MEVSGLYCVIGRDGNRTIRPQDRCSGSRTVPQTKEVDGTSGRFFVLFPVWALAALPALAIPNFSGDWKLNTSKIPFGEIPSPDSMTLKITHDAPKLSPSTKQ